MKIKGLTSLTLSVFLMVGFSGNAYAYVLYGVSWPNGQATMHSVGGNATDNGNNAFVEAMNNWNGLSNFTFYNVSDHMDPCADPNTYGPPWYNGWAFRFDACGTAFGTGVVAVNRRWTSGSTIAQDGIVFNAVMPWAVFHGSHPDYVDFRRVATHELGHALGLGHDNTYPAIMNTTYSETIETPQVDDINGIRAIYGGGSTASVTGSVAVYRFWSDNLRHHFFTTSPNEKDHLICCNPDWNYEGIAYFAYPEQYPGTSPVYRFWSDAYQGHLFTASSAEKDDIICCNPNWTYEGISWFAYNSEQPNTIAVYRFWSDALKGYFYTTNTTERDHLICCNPDWRYEGIAYYALP